MAIAAHLQRLPAASLQHQTPGFVLKLCIAMVVTSKYPKDCNFQDVLDALALLNYI